MKRSGLAVFLGALLFIGALVAAASEPAEIPALRTEFSKTFATAPGLFEARVYLEPIHVRDAGGAWVDPIADVRDASDTIPGGMTYVCSGNPDDESGSASTAWVGKDPEPTRDVCEALVNKVDLAALAGKRILDASFTAYLYENHLTDTTDFALWSNAGAFAESTVTWNSRPSLATQLDSIPVTTATTGTLTWNNVEGLIRAQVSGYLPWDRGFTIRDNDPNTGYLRVRTEDTGTVEKPFYTITYENPTAVNDTCATATDISTAGGGSGDTSTAANDAFAPDPYNDGFLSGDIVFLYTAPADGTVAIGLVTDGFNAIVYAREGDCASGDVIAFGNDTTDGIGDIENIEFDVAGGDDYYIFVDGHDGVDVTTVEEGGVSFSLNFIEDTDDDADDDSDDDVDDDSDDDADDDADDDSDDDADDDADDDTDDDDDAADDDASDDDEDIWGDDDDDDDEDDSSGCGC